MKKVLIITYYWPPGGGAGVQRWLKFVKYLPEFGWTPVVYTAENPETPAIDESLMKDVPDGLEVHRQPIWEPLDAYRKFTGRKAGEKFGAGFLSESAAPKARDRFALWVRGNLFIPDAKRFWIAPSIRYLTAYLKENPVDLIVSSGPPHSLHLIALKLKQRFGLQWVADFRDPWTEIDFYQALQLSPMADRRHNRLEQKVLDKADLVVSVGQNMMEAFAAKTRTPQVVITNGFDAADFPEVDETVENEQFILLHLGSVNRDRNHPVLWEALKNLLERDADFADKLRFRLIGKLDHSVQESIKEYGLEQWVETIDYVPHSEVFNHLKQASVLYLPLNNTPNAKGILTGKVFEYFAARRQVLALGPPDGDLGNILKATHTGEMLDFDDREGVEEALTMMFEHFKRKSLKVEAKGIERFERRNLTGQLVNEFEKLFE
jgi:glycosyltransferase involved in cell wall biosynthesis